MRDTDTDKSTTTQRGKCVRMPEISSEDLLGEHREITIVHNRECYRLRVTSNEKLILTK